MVATYAGYWMAGAALLAVAMIASMLTDNQTVAFILGGLFCAALVFLDQASAITSGTLQRVAERLSVVEQLRDVLSGALTLNALVYFVGIAVAALYLNTALVGRRRWPTGPKAPRFGRHYVLRAASLVVAVGSLTVLVSQTRIRWDATSEQIHSLSPETVALLKGLDKKQPVFIYAYFSPEVPRSYVDARNSLVGMLREFDAAGGEAIHSRIVETVKYSPAAREAEERYNIRPYRIPATEDRDFSRAGVHARVGGVRDSLFRPRSALRIRTGAVYPCSVARQAEEDRHPEHAGATVRGFRLPKQAAEPGVVHRGGAAQAV
jgi:ABC-2 type transport system permease protein